MVIIYSRYDIKYEVKKSRQVTVIEIISVTFVHK